jgi:hypothetical protein
VFRKEMDFYCRSLNRYGLPLDNRKAYTKLDWTLWTATITNNQDDFEALVTPVVRFLAETPDRQPMTDWYQTDSGQKVGFTARSVVGGVFMRMLYDDQLWQKWAKRDNTRAGHYAALPRPPQVQSVVAAADTAPAKWRYTTERPDEGWQSSEYDDSTWKEGVSGFGTKETPGARVGTVWNSPDIWLRRKFDFRDNGKGAPQLFLHHDDDAEVYINGVLARRARGYTTDYGQFPILADAAATLKPTDNVLAVHCHQNAGGQYIDVGIVTLEPTEK